MRASFIILVLLLGACAARPTKPAAMVPASAPKSAEESEVKVIKASATIGDLIPRDAEYVAFRPNESLTTAEVIRLITQEKFRPANAETLAHFVAENPELWPVVALGGERHPDGVLLVSVHRYLGQTAVIPVKDDYRWQVGYFFLAVR